MTLKFHINHYNFIINPQLINISKISSEISNNVMIILWSFIL